MGKQTLSLPELIDAEVALRQDSRLAPEALHERDVQIAGKLKPKFDVPLDRVPLDRLVSAWSREVLPTPSPGTRFLATLSLADLFLTLVGILSGGSLAAAILRYDGSSPINAIQYLGFFVALQAVLIFITAFHGVFVGGLGFLQEALRSFLYFRSRLLSAFGDHFVTLRHMHAVFSKPEKWLILRMTQKFAFAFQMSALVVTLALVSFSDLAFSWSTTLSLQPEFFYKFLNALAWPWRWMGDDWLLSLEQIRQTQYFRLEGRYVPSGAISDVTDVRMVGSWWRYLVAAHVTYGLLPRLVFWVVCQVKLKRSLRSIRLDGFAYATLRRRLLGSMGPRVDDVAVSKDGQKSLDVLTSPCEVIAWRDFPASEEEIHQFLKSQFAVEVANITAVGGASGVMAKDQITSSRQGRSWALLVEGWESPGKAFKGLLADIRQVDPEGMILVLPVTVENGAIQPASSDRLTLWRRHLDAIGDRHVGVAI